MATLSMLPGTTSLPGDTPEWLGCDLLACQVVVDASEQIVENCRKFGAQLQGVCGKALEKLPPPGAVPEGRDEYDCADECLTFLSSFGMFSHALMQLAGDLELAVTQPLMSKIAVMTEESIGYMKHWRQVRTRFAELQERYHRNRKRSLEAKGRLEGEKRGLFTRGTVDGKAASQQHAAMRDLAICEEGLKESEASLRQLEAESRERIQQLEKEKKDALSGALTRGAGALKCLLPVVGGAPAPAQWSGVVPLGRTKGSSAAAGHTSASSSTATATPHRGQRKQVVSEQEDDDESEEDRNLAENCAPGAVRGVAAASVGSTFRSGVSLFSVEEQSVPQKGNDVDTSSVELNLFSSGPVETASKYLQGAGSSCAESSELCDVSEVNEVPGVDELAPADIGSRSEGWSLMSRPAPRKARRSFVFQSPGKSLCAESNVHRDGRRSQSAMPRIRTEESLLAASPPVSCLFRPTEATLAKTDAKEAAGAADPSKGTVAESKDDKPSPCDAMVLEMNDTATCIDKDQNTCSA